MTIIVSQGSLKEASHEIIFKEPEGLGTKRALQSETEIGHYRR